jgi:hypothetical protein
VLPEIPENLITKPTLTWHYENRSKNAHELEVSYLTKNMSWKADYVLVLNSNDTTTDMSGWVTLDNKSGAMYKDARLKLVAGDVHRVKGEELEVKTLLSGRGKYSLKAANPVYGNFF